MANKKYYGVASFGEKRTVNGKELMSGYIKGKIAKTSNALEVQGEGTKTRVNFSVRVQNQDKTFERYANDLGALANTYKPDGSDNAYNTIPVTVWGYLANNLPKYAHVGDEVIVIGDLVPNTYNGKTTLRMEGVLGVEVTRRADAVNSEKGLTADVDAVEKAYTKPANIKEAVEQPSFNAFDDEDTPF